MVRYDFKGMKYVTQEWTNNSALKMCVHMHKIAKTDLLHTFKAACKCGNIKMKGFYCTGEFGSVVPL